MHVCILSRKSSLHSTSNLMRAALERDHDVSVIDPMQCNLSMGKGQPRIHHDGEEVRDVDVVIPRIGASITTYGLAVVSHFEMMGVPVVNSPAGIARSRDKLRSMQILSRMDIDMPRTFICRNPEDLDHAIRFCGGFPVILKLLQGTQGIGVMIADSRDSAESILDTFYSMGHLILIQQFIKESRGKDIRALVLGDRVFAAMKREARMGEFRSNIHRGGRGSLVRLTPEEEAVAIKSAKVLGLNIAGVDMLMSNEGPKVIEVNSSPGFEGLEAATRLDVSGAIIDYTVEFAKGAKLSQVIEKPAIP